MHLGFPLTFCLHRKFKSSWLSAWDFRALFSAYMSVFLHSPLCSIHVRIAFDYMTLQQHFATELFVEPATSACNSDSNIYTSTYAGIAPTGALHSASLGSLAGTLSANQPCHRCAVIIIFIMDAYRPQACYLCQCWTLWCLPRMSPAFSVFPASADGLVLVPS